MINGNGRRGRFWLLRSSFEQSGASEVLDGIVTTPLRLGGKAQVEQWSLALLLRRSSWAMKHGAGEQLEWVVRRNGWGTTSYRLSVLLRRSDFEVPFLGSGCPSTPLQDNGDPGRIAAGITNQRMNNGFTAPF